jgi:hypothetical protein
LPIAEIDVLIRLAVRCAAVSALFGVAAGSEFVAGAEGGRVLGTDRDFLIGFGIAAGGGLGFFDGERAEAADLDAVATRERAPSQLIG